MFRAQRKPAVHEHGSQLFLRNIGFQDQQRTKLRIPILLDHEADVMLIAEFFYILVKREAAYAHEIGLDSALGQNVERLAHRWIAAAQSHDSDAGAVATFDDRRRHELG